MGGAAADNKQTTGAKPVKLPNREYDTRKFVPGTAPHRRQPGLGGQNERLQRQDQPGAGGGVGGVYTMNLSTGK